MTSTSKTFYCLKLTRSNNILNDKNILLYIQSIMSRTINSHNYDNSKNEPLFSFTNLLAS